MLFFNIFKFTLSLTERYCPPRWIWLKVGSFDRSSLKCEEWRFFEKSTRPLSSESHFKLQHPLVQLLAIRVLITNSAYSSVCGLLNILLIRRSLAGDI
jgi:hypothetical protein